MGLKLEDMACKNIDSQTLTSTFGPTLENPDTAALNHVVDCFISHEESNPERFLSTLIAQTAAGRHCIGSSSLFGARMAEINRVIDRLSEAGESTAGQWSRMMRNNLCYTKIQ